MPIFKSKKPISIFHVIGPVLGLGPGSGTEGIVSAVASKQALNGYNVSVGCTADSKFTGPVSMFSYYPCGLRTRGYKWSDQEVSDHFAYIWDQIVANRPQIVHVHLSSVEERFFDFWDPGIGIPIVGSHYTRFPMDASIRRSTWDPNRQPHLREMRQVKWIAPTAAAAKSAPFRSQWKVNFPIQDHFFSNPLTPRNKRSGYALWVGALTPGKGAHLAIKAALKVGKKIVLIGPIDRDDARQVAYYSQFVEPLVQAYPNRVVYLSRQSSATVLRYMLDAEVVLTPYSWTEWHPMIIPECFASGTPVVGFDRGPIRELVGPDCGIVIPQRNPMADDELLLWDWDTKKFQRHQDEVVRKLAKALADLPHSVGSPQHLRDYAQSKFTITRAVNQLDNIYRSVLG